MSQSTTGRVLPPQWRLDGVRLLDKTVPNEQSENSAERESDGAGSFMHDAPRYAQPLYAFGCGTIRI
jgi:hypothetical protein